MNISGFTKLTPVARIDRAMRVLDIEKLLFMVI